MKILSFGCAGYKAFREPVSIDVRPLTLFFGKNHSGKSVLLRLTRLLLRAISSPGGRGFPLVVDGLSYGRVFHELIHGGGVHGHMELSMALGHDGERLDLAATVQNLHGGLPVVARFCLASGSLDVDWQWEAAFDEVATYRGVGRVPFRGLWPDPRIGGAGHELRSRLEVWRERIATLEERLEHLGPLRKDCQRISELGFPGRLDFFGEGAINQLASPDGALLDAVGQWYQRHLEGWRVDLVRSGKAVEPVLVRGKTSVSLADGGQGMQHLLPVVVQQLGHQLGDQAPFVLLVEEPELHLHAAAQAPLGDLFLETARTGRGQVMVETHSENLLLRIRRRIAEGQDPELVALYWVGEHPEGHGSVRRITIQRNGEVDWWPEGVFSEGYQEVRHLRRAGQRTTSGEVVP